MPPHRLLLVDDEEKVVRALERLFLEEEYDIITASSAEEALETLNGTGVSLIISDHGMPGMKGIDFLKHIKGIFPHTVCILLTGTADLTTAVDAINSGSVYRYIAKPWDNDECKLIVREALAKFEIEEENRRLVKENEEQNKVLKKLNQNLRRAQELLRISFQRYMNAHLVQEILSSSKPVSLSGEKKDVTVLISDIRDFTPMAERVPTEDLVEFLNQYFGVMVDIVLDNDGLLDKFMGDAIMAIFGAVYSNENDPLNAVKAAVQMQKALKDLNDRWAREDKPQISIGVGISTGESIVGNIGSEERMEFTAIGQDVNYAERIEKLTKTFPSPILISESTHRLVKDHIRSTRYGPVEIKGKKEPIYIYGVDELIE